jgi:hypothetical protein
MSSGGFRLVGSLVSGDIILVNEEFLLQVEVPLDIKFGSEPGRQEPIG